MDTIKRFLMVEPVSVTAAVTGTLGVLLLFGVTPEVIGAITVFISGWLVVLRQMLTPNSRVALTNGTGVLEC